MNRLKLRWYAWRLERWMKKQTPLLLWTDPESSPLQDIHDWIRAEEPKPWRR